MEWLVWIGATISAAGLVGVLFSVLYVIRARRAGLGDAALRERLHRAMVWNLGAFFLSMLGLMVVVVGVLLS